MAPTFTRPTCKLSQINARTRFRALANVIAERQPLYYYLRLFRRVLWGNRDPLDGSAFREFRFDRFWVGPRKFSSTVKWSQLQFNWYLINSVVNTGSQMSNHNYQPQHLFYVVFNVIIQCGNDIEKMWLMTRVTKN